YSPFASDALLYRYPDGLNPLTRDTNTRTGHFGLNLNGDAQQWRWTVTGNFDRSVSRTLTQRGIAAPGLQARLDAGDPDFNPFAPLPIADLVSLPADQAHSASNVGSLEAFAAGPLASLPAGKINASVRVGARTSDYETGSYRLGIAQSADLGRD